LYDGGNATAWAQTCSHAVGSGDGSLIIADVAKGDGAGPARVASWASVIHNCGRYGKASAIGYVWTNYGQVSVATVEAGIDNWYRFYPGDIAGVFLDGVSDTIPGTTTSNTVYYRTLASYIHTKHRNDSEVVVNFGYNPASGWMFSAGSKKDADLVVTFEGAYNDPSLNPYTSWVQPAWELEYPAADFAALVYDAPNTTATAATEHGVRRPRPPTRRIRLHRHLVRPDALPRRRLLKGVSDSLDTSLHLRIFVTMTSMMSPDNDLILGLILG